MFPEPGHKQEVALAGAAAESEATGRSLWYCKQCGYVVFREEAPYICPICKAKKEFFAEIRLEIKQKTS